VVEFERVIKKINSELDCFNKVSNIVSMRRNLLSLGYQGDFISFLSITKKINALENKIDILLVFVLGRFSRSDSAEILVRFQNQEWKREVILKK
jgi:hypothetical protein